MSSLGVFLNQEIDRFNVLLKVMKHSLDQLDRAIAGTVVMSGDLEVMMSKVLDDRVPPGWEAVGYPSLKPLASWVTDLLERLTFMGGWVYDGLPNSYWVSSFFFP
jgi:dynein heavy chain